MIQAANLRPGNIILMKMNTRVLPVTLNMENFHLPFTDPANCYPLVLKEEQLNAAGFIENEKYPLRPATREFRLMLPVPGSTNRTEFIVLVREAQENFGRYFVNDTPASAPFRSVHEMQNLYESLTGEALKISPGKGR